MPHADFDLQALSAALDEQRRERNLSWAAATREINRFVKVGRAIAASTVVGLRTRQLAEADGILQMLLWLRRTPESFVPGFVQAGAERYRLRTLDSEQILRCDTAALHAALNKQRQDRGMSWNDVATEVGGCTSGMLTNLAKGGRTAFPGVMRIVRWLDQPMAVFTRASDW